MAKYIKQRSIDDHGGKEYDLVPDDIRRALRYRFDGGSASVIHPDKPGCILHDIENFWDGPTEVRDLGGGELEYKSPYTGRTDRFNTQGWYDDAGVLHRWEDRQL